MSEYRDPLSWHRLWAVRWLTGTLFLAQIVGGFIGLLIFSRPDGFDNFWLGGTLAMIPGFVAGLFAQHRADSARLRENRVTVWLLGVIAAIVFMFAVNFAPQWMHAG